MAEVEQPRFAIVCTDAPCKHLFGESFDRALQVLDASKPVLDEEDLLLRYLLKRKFNTKGEGYDVFRRVWTCDVEPSDTCRACGEDVDCEVDIENDDEEEQSDDPDAEGEYAFQSHCAECKETALEGAGGRLCGFCASPLREAGLDRWRCPGAMAMDDWIEVLNDGCPVPSKEELEREWEERRQQKKEKAMKAKREAAKEAAQHPPSAKKAKASPPDSAVLPALVQTAV
jgi:hypothetical protein